MEMEFETTTVFQAEIQEEIQELEEIQEPEQVQEQAEEMIVAETIVEDVAEVTEVGEVTTSETTEETTVTTTQVIDYRPLLTSINNNIVDTNLFLFLITVTMFIVILYSWLKSLLNI